MTPWVLPREAVFGGKIYEIHTDYRDILEILTCFENLELTDSQKWQIALALFYEEQIPSDYLQQAMEFLSDFLCGGNVQEDVYSPKLLDWRQDANLIIAEVNKVAGKEIRLLPYVHWWTFLSWFHSIGEGQLSLVVGIREKLRTGKQLAPYESEYYRVHKSTVDLKACYSGRELEEREALNRLLAGEST